MKIANVAFNKRKREKFPTSTFSNVRFMCGKVNVFIVWTVGQAILRHHVDLKIQVQFQDGHFQILYTSQLMNYKNYH